MALRLDLSKLLLRTKAAIRLYESHARDLPIVDYHCHIDPAVVANNEGYDEIVDMWIACDPYKWRAMRLNGIPERLITGDAPNEEKFKAWARTVPRLVGNPLFHWSAMELNSYFDIQDTLCEENAMRIRHACNEQLRTQDFRAQSLLRRDRVERFCTSDDWTEGLEHHQAVRSADSRMSMLPSLRADKALAVETPEYRTWVEHISVTADVPVTDFDSYKRALIELLDRFDRCGCRMGDHGLRDASFVLVTEKRAAALFDCVLQGNTLSGEETLSLRSALLVFLIQEYARRDWVLQLHLGAERKTSSRLRRLCGSAGGYACIGNSLDVIPLCNLLDYMEKQDALPRTILYPLNPTDFEKLASLTGSFAEDGTPGKIQLGPAWWYNDHCGGIRRQLKAVAAYSLLGSFVGMTTDSRSLLSTVRHDYFRRLLCDLIGGWVTDGILPDDDAILGPIIRAICYENANRMLTM